MDNNWAADHLQTIRTLMERSALYRRALAPIMLLAGIAGIVAMGIGLRCHLDSPRAFGALWLGTAMVVVLGALLITRRQALKDDDKFWSPPTRRVAQALLPPLLVGLVVGVCLTLADHVSFVDFTLLLPFVWAMLYGCAVISAGFFMQRGVKWFGWGMVILAGGGLFLLILVQPQLEVKGHWFMGFFFGFLHLLYGSYLYLTEKKHPDA